MLESGQFDLDQGVRLPLISAAAFRSYRLLGSEARRALLRRLILLLEGGPFFSLTLRDILRRYHGVHVGLYTAEPCSGPPKYLHPRTSFGRYCSIAPSVRTFTRNHPMSTKSTHGMFYHSGLGKVSVDPIPRTNLAIGHGVIIGESAIILPPTESIGIGALIMPGSVVYSNIPPYAIAAGFPARLVGYRHQKETVAQLLASSWWELSVDRLRAQKDILRLMAGGQLETTFHSELAVPLHQVPAKSSEAVRVVGGKLAALFYAASELAKSVTLSGI